MLTVVRSNRAEFLVDVLAQHLRLAPPDPLQQIQVVVNTWPTSRWLGEQLALRLGGIAANLRFPFPAAHLSALVDQLLDPLAVPGPDPWRASRLVWPLLELLPSIAREPQGEPLRHWLAQHPLEGGLELNGWQLGRAIADAFDDYALYRPELLAAWESGIDGEVGGGMALPSSQRWQPLLYRALRQRLGREPFALRVERAIALLRSRTPEALEPGLPCGGGVLRLFGLSSLAPVQVRLLQALSGSLDVDLYLLTPCRDLWQRCQERRQELRDALALQLPFGEEWLRRAPGLEARFGRLGAEFQQLLEGSGEAQLGESRFEDLYLVQPSPPAAPSGQGVQPGVPPPLLAQLQEQLVEPGRRPELSLSDGDHSLEFHPCPGALRQVQIVRDRLLQLLAERDDLEPRDILVMTPDIERFAPLVASVFSDAEATGVSLPWRLTDRSQQAQSGVARTLLRLLMAAERLTASGLESLLDCPALQQRFALEPRDIVRLNRELQRLGFRWGLDAEQRGGERTHSLSWAMDRLLLSLALPASPGLALGDADPVAPAEVDLPLDLLGRWLQLLQRLRHWLQQLAGRRRAADWVPLLQRLVTDLFEASVQSDAELAPLLAAIADGLAAAAAGELELEAAVLAAVLEESLAVDAGRFGHRSGALTISALEPMRAIPHRVIVLMGLDADCFPRRLQRPGFHLIGQQRRLGDADPADQDRYILMEALLSAREHLLISWSCRDDRTGETLPPSSPVRHWLDWLRGSLGDRLEQLQWHHPASPLERENFLPQRGGSALSCDRRLLEARQALERGADPAPAGLIFLADPLPPAEAVPSPASESVPLGVFEDLQGWLLQPQRHWLQQLGLRPREWQERFEDLEAVELEERQRAALLRRARETPDNGGEAPCGDAEFWLRRSRGTGLLPGLSAGQLEAEALVRRWQSLEAVLEGLGDGWSGSLSWGGLQTTVQGRGDALVLLHLGRESISQQLSLWLQLLLACTAPMERPRPRRGVLISRDKGDAFVISTRLMAPAEPQAAARIEQLLALRQAWRERCWPVPPRTGWSWLQAEARRPGSGAAGAIAVWEGGAFQRAEREQEEMEVCFGSQLPTEQLLEGAFSGCASALFGPLLEALEPSGSARRTAP